MGIFKRPSLYIIIYAARGFVKYYIFHDNTMPDDAYGRQHYAVGNNVVSVYTKVYSKY